MYQYNNHVIFDEVQKVPEIFPYLKMEVDKDRQNYGKFIITEPFSFHSSKKSPNLLREELGCLLFFHFNTVKSQSY